MESADDLTWDNECEIVREIEIFTPAHCATPGITHGGRIVTNSGRASLIAVY